MHSDIVDKFSTHLKTALTRALCFVVENELKVIEPEHLLWALGTQKGSLAAEILRKANVVEEDLRKLIGKGSKQTSSDIQNQNFSLLLSEDAKRVLEKAVLTAHIYGHRYIGTEHLLSGLMQVGGMSITNFFLDKEKDIRLIKEQLGLVLKNTSRLPELTETLVKNNSKESTPKNDNDLTATIEDEDSPEEKKKTPALDYFGIDLTSEKIQDGVDPVIAREDEILRVMEILCRRTKNNPLLLGEPGVGKTAIVEGLAKKILNNDVPSALLGKRVIGLDLTLVIAGTMYRGEFEARLKQIIEEVKQDPDIILFIDEVHTIIGAGSASGSMDAANILKPALARGEIRCIGATTPDEYKKNFESDNALERRFQIVKVEEPSYEKTLDILKGIAPYFEKFHSVKFTPEAIENAVSLSSRYITNKHQPDKAIDLIDEAASSHRVNSKQPGPLEERRIKENELSKIREEKRQAVIEEKFLDAIALKEKEQSLKMTLNQELEKTEGQSAVIDGKHIANVVSRITGIPLNDILMEEQQALSNLEEELSKFVLGQNKAVDAIALGVRRAKTQMHDPKRPLSSFLFLGPSGVGKTELSRVLSEILFNDRKSLIRLDMSEYSEGFTVSKLIGAPAGYVGYRERSKLTDQVKQRPYSVVLFDEIEKAHSDVQNLLLQILEEGEITDSTNRPVSFKNTIIILTSNVGMERFWQGGMGFISGETNRVLERSLDLKQHLEERFRPELLNRIDHTVIFEPLSVSTLEKIAEKELKDLINRMDERGISFTYEREIIEHLVKNVDEKNGARDLKRSIQKEIEAKIADRLIKGKPISKLHGKISKNKVSLIRPKSNK